jgi:hypothetical protein
MNDKAVDIAELTSGDPKATSEPFQYSRESVVNQRNGTLFKPNTFAWSNGINRLTEVPVIVSTTINCL